MSDIDTRLGRIEGKLDDIIKRREDHELRIRSLETLASQAAGGWKIIVILASIAGAVGAGFHALISKLKI